MSKDLKEVRELVLWLSEGKESAKALREPAWCVRRAA